MLRGVRRPRQRIRVVLRGAPHTPRAAGPRRGQPRRGVRDVLHRSLPIPRNIVQKARRGEAAVVGGGDVPVALGARQPTPRIVVHAVVRPAKEGGRGWRERRGYRGRNHRVRGCVTDAAVGVGSEGRRRGGQRG